MGRGAPRSVEHQSTRPRVGCFSFSSTHTRVHSKTHTPDRRTRFVLVNLISHFRCPRYRPGSNCKTVSLLTVRLFFHPSGFPCSPVGPNSRAQSNRNCTKDILSRGDFCRGSPSREGEWSVLVSAMSPHVERKEMVSQEPSVVTKCWICVTPTGTSYRRNFRSSASQAYGGIVEVSR